MLAPVPERRRQMNAFEKLLERFAATRPGGWFFVHIGNRIDPFLLRASRGWVSTGLGAPVLLLEHRGARSGRTRATPLLYLTDDERIVLVASNAGSKRHPSWYHNIRANPEVQIFARGRSGRYRAREAEGEERERLWELVNDLYAGYDIYQGRAGDRRIPVVVCEPQ
jgi:deazaflavin-dependent oxidoreductase (nitroreductase family)